MSAKNPIIKATLHNAAKTMSNEDRSTLTSAIGNKTADRVRNQIETRQNEIDHYNAVTCNIINPFFNNIQLAGKQIIVRLHKENYIKGISEYVDGLPFYDAWISQVDGRMRQTDRENWVDNPLPYIFTGVVVAISPGVVADVNAEKENLTKNNVSVDDYKTLEVGDIVHLEHFMYADKRFYLNKQQRDFLKNPNEYRIEHWEGYVKVHPTLIEGIVKDKANFLEETSVYAKHKLLKK